MAITNNILTTSPANVYVSSGTSAISAMYFCNFSANTVTFSAYAISSGNVASVANQIYYNIQLASGDTYIADWEKLALNSGDMIQANASAGSSITATISYVSV